MSENDSKPIGLTQSLAGLKPKEKAPNSASNLEKWIVQVESKIDGARSGRLAWLAEGTLFES